MAERNVKVRAVRSDGQVFEYEGEDWKILSLEGIDFRNLRYLKAPEAMETVR